MQSSMTSVSCPSSSRAQSHLHAGPRRSALEGGSIASTAAAIALRRGEAATTATTTATTAPGRLGRRPPAQRRHLTLLPPPNAGAMDGMPVWTLDQIAGLAFGGVMLGAVLASRQVDEWVARAQRRGLGVCERCGGANGDRTTGGCAEQGCPLRASGGGGGSSSSTP